MIRKLSAWLLYRCMGFRFESTIPLPPKYVIALAPHTSNWDFIVGILHSRAEGNKCNFMMKKFWFFWPLGYVMRALGGIPVERSKKSSLTDQMAEQAKSRETFKLCITPEGTRKRVSEWKKGFYYIALKADIPILLYALDYQSKTIRCTKSIMPNGDIDNQMAEIKEYYRNVKGKKPELFTVD